MPRTDFGPMRTDSTVVKTEGKNRISRDESTAPAGVGPLEVGTVMVRAADGTLGAISTATGTTTPPTAANCVLLESVESGNAAVRVVTLNRHAEVVRQELRFPTGLTAADQTAAINALRDLGIVARRGV